MDLFLIFTTRVFSEIIINCGLRADKAANMIQYASSRERCERGRHDWKGSMRVETAKRIPLRCALCDTRHKTCVPRYRATRCTDERVSERAGGRARYMVATRREERESHYERFANGRSKKGAAKGDFSLVIHGRCIMFVRGKGNIPLRKWAERHVKLRLFRAAVQRLHPWIHFFPSSLRRSLSHPPRVRHCGDRSLAWNHIFN